MTAVACRATCTGCELYAESDGNRTFDGQSVICWKCWVTLMPFSESKQMLKGEWDQALEAYTLRRVA